MKPAVQKAHNKHLTAGNRAFVFGGNGSSFLEEFLERPTNRLQIILCMMQGQNFPRLTLENLYFGEEIG
jgi:hypothetical protein